MITQLKAIIWRRLGIHLPSYMSSCFTASICLVSLSFSAQVAFAQFGVSSEVDGATVAYWRFEETAGNTVGDATGTNPGTANGTVIVTGRSGRARYFNRLAGNYITVPDNVSLRDLAQITIEAWVRPASFSANYYTESIVRKGRSIAPYNLYDLGLFSNDDGTIRFFLDYINASFGGAAMAESTVSHPTEQWYYVAGTYDGIHAKLYVNGVLEATSQAVPGIIVTTSDPLFIHNHTFSGGQSNGVMGGIIDEVRISRIARPQDELTPPLSTGATGNNGSIATAMSPSGRFVLIVSAATDLVPGQVDTPADPSNWLGSEELDSFLYDRQAASLALASHAADSQTVVANGWSFPFAISADGMYVLFNSRATNLTPAQVEGNTAADVFLWNRATGQVTLVSHVAGSSDRTGNGQSLVGSMSQDGAYIAFESSASDLTTGDSGFSDDVFVWKRTTGNVTLVSHAFGSPGTPANGISSFPSGSSDGAYVLFQSSATNLVRNQSDNNGGGDLFLWDRATGKVRLVTHAPDSPNRAANGESYPTDRGFSGNGRYVAFESRATNLISGQVDSNGDLDVFLWERDTGRIRLLSHAANSPTLTGNGSSFVSGISNDGSYVGFVSRATNLVAGQNDSNGDLDLFLWERASGKVRLISHAAGSTTLAGNRRTDSARISADGKYMTFRSEATDLMVGLNDGNDRADAFIWHRPTGKTSLISSSSEVADMTANGATFARFISANGAYVVIDSGATDLVSGLNDGNSNSDTFIWERLTGKIVLMSSTPDQ
jgi:Concanavalin A-like lectin/glucanases superfamily